jgi:hypothetical protein
MFVAVHGVRLSAPHRAAHAAGAARRASARRARPAGRAARAASRGGRVSCSAEGEGAGDTSKRTLSNLDAVLGVVEEPPAEAAPQARWA